MMTSRARSMASASVLAPRIRLALRSLPESNVSCFRVFLLAAIMPPLEILGTTERAVKQWLLSHDPMSLSADLDGLEPHFHSCAKHRGPGNDFEKVKGATPLHHRDPHF